MINQAFFRLPGQQDILFIEQDVKGSDKFVIRPFQPSLAPEYIVGDIQSIDLKSCEKLISSWRYSIADEVNIVDYESVIRLAVESIQKGEFVKVVPARQKLLASDVGVFTLFGRLLQHYKEAFVYVFNLNGKIMIGASPETLMRKNAKGIITEALGGTRTHGRYSEKESDEHKHIVDYISGELKLQGYKFEQLETQSRKAGPVEHLSTGFKLESRGLENDQTLPELLHPTPAVCGLPFEPAFDFIKKYEGFDRAFYSGYIGPMYKNGNFELFVNLRCAEVFEGYYKLFAGAGINALSKPDDEFNETENKMQTIAQWLK